MKRVFFSLLIIFILLSSPFSSALGQQPVKGRWTFSTYTPLGQFDAFCIFKANGKGQIIRGDNRLVPLSYREKGTSFSAAFEGIEFLPEGIDISAVFRGIKIDENTIDGNLLIITEIPDNSSPLGFYSFQLPFVGKRN